MSADRYSRQSLLGPQSDEILGTARIGIVGLGGGGSHIVQQLAHLGVKHFVLYDFDLVEESNLNRLVGATLEDARLARPKVAVMRRIVEALHAEADVETRQLRWQEEPGSLRSCDMVIGCLDGLQERRELEVCARRFLLPYVDIGLGVKRVAEEAPRMAGQVILSMPGAPCFECVGLLNTRDLAEEAAAYGQAGPRPQVVWANGVLASLAVGVAVDLLTDWTRATRAAVYLTFDANTGAVQAHPKASSHRPATTCPHYPQGDVGEPTYATL